MAMTPEQIAAMLGAAASQPVVAPPMAPVQAPVVQSDPAAEFERVKAQLRAIREQTAEDAAAASAAARLKADPEKRRYPVVETAKQEAQVRKDLEGQGLNQEQIDKKIEKFKKRGGKIKTSAKLLKVGRILGDTLAGYNPRGYQPGQPGPQLTQQREARLDAAGQQAYANVMASGDEQAKLELAEAEMGLSQIAKQMADERKQVRDREDAEFAAVLADRQIARDLGIAAYMGPIEEVRAAIVAERGKSSAHAASVDRAELKYKQAQADAASALADQRREGPDGGGLTGKAGGEFATSLTEGNAFTEDAIFSELSMNPGSAMTADELVDAVYSQHIALRDAGMLSAPQIAALQSRIDALRARYAAAQRRIDEIPAPVVSQTKAELADVEARRLTGEISEGEARARASEIKRQPMVERQNTESDLRVLRQNTLPVVGNEVTKSKSLGTLYDAASAPVDGRSSIIGSGIRYQPVMSAREFRQEVERRFAAGEIDDTTRRTWLLKADDLASIQRKAGRVAVSPLPRSR